MSKTVIIMRHANAISKPGLDDSSRPLSDLGKEQHKRISQTLKDKGFTPQQIFCSPLIRAKETAQITSEAMDNCPVDIEEALGPSFDGSHLIHVVNACENQFIVLVGHQPNLSQFIYDLSGIDNLNGGLVPSGTVILKFSSQAGFGNAKFVEYLHP